MKYLLKFIKELIMKIQAKKIYLAFLFFMGAMSMSVFAQGPPSDRQGPPPIPNEKQIEKMVSDLSTELSLSADQQSRIQGLYTKHFEEVGSLQKEGDRETHRKSMETLRESFETEVQIDFNQEQRDLYAEFQKKQGEKRMGKRRPEKKS